LRNIRRLAGCPKPPGGSYEIPEPGCKTHVLPSGSSCAARRFLEKYRKRESKQKLKVSQFKHGT